MGCGSIARPAPSATASAVGSQSRKTGSSACLARDEIPVAVAHVQRTGLLGAVVGRRRTARRRQHDLFAAVYQQAADRLLAETRFDPGDTLVDQLIQGLDTHLDYFIANRNAVLAANRVLAGDPVIQTIMTDELDALRARLLGVLPLANENAREAVSSVLRSWLVFVQTLCVDWLTRQTCTRTELHDVRVGAVLGAIRPLLASDPAPDRPR
ncbi:TetR/AcrR family transcriptional regulator [Kitasatospora cathayae]|uniref:TetR/AcrR family transcriptional regulator n=1 Tax=Kitasatospora cathayae TaxID=3004092 RepID=UPI0038602DE5